MNKANKYNQNGDYNQDIHQIKVIYSMANAKQHSLVGQNLWFDQTPLNYYD
jgi:hypothetical protein